MPCEIAPNLGLDRIVIVDDPGRKDFVLWCLQQSGAECFFPVGASQMPQNFVDPPGENCKICRHFDQFGNLRVTNKFKCINYSTILGGYLIRFHE